MIKKIITFLYKKGWIVYLSIYFTTIIIVSIQYPIFYSNSPDVVADKIFIEHFARTHTIGIADNADINLKYKNVFKTRGTVVNKDHLIMPLKAVGNIYFYGSIYSFFYNHLSIEVFLSLFNIFLSFISIILIIALLSCITNENTYDSIFVLAPAYLYYNINSENITNLYSVISFLGLFSYIHWYKNTAFRKINIFFIISSIGFSVAVLIRYEYILLLIPYFTSIIVINKFSRKSIFTAIIYCILPVASVIAALLFNNINFGSYFSFGYSLLPDASNNFSGRSSIIDKLFSMIFITRPNISEIIINVYYSIFLIFPLVLSFALFQLFYNLRKGINFIFVFIYVHIIFFLLYYGSANSFYGYGTSNIESSYIRYFSPVYFPILTIAVIAYNVLSSKFTIFIKLLFASFITIFSLVTFISTKVDNYLYSNNYKKSLTLASEIIPDNSVIFTNYWDKLFYRKYLVATYSDQVVNNMQYFETMRNYSIDNPDTPIYYIPNNESDSNEFELFLIRYPASNCRSISYMNMCKFEPNTFNSNPGPSTW